VITRIVCVPVNVKTENIPNMSRVVNAAELPTSQETLSLHNANLLILLRDSIAVYCANLTVWTAHRVLAR
jgi:hypothetical protein